MIFLILNFKPISLFYIRFNAKATIKITAIMVHECIVLHSFHQNESNVLFTPQIILIEFLISIPMLVSMVQIPYYYFIHVTEKTYSYQNNVIPFSLN